MNVRLGNRRLSLPILPLIVCLVAACTDAAGPDPILLEVVAGDGQEAQIGTSLPSALIVHVMGLDSVPREGVRVDWTVLQGGGAIEASAASTDAEGTVHASWTLGSDLGMQVVRVSAGGESVELGAWAAPPPPDDWMDVIEIRPEAHVEPDGETLIGNFWLFSRWGGTLRLTTANGCYFDWGYPALYAEGGELVKAANFFCTAWRKTDRIPPGDSLYRQVEMNVASVPAGEYTVRIRFAVGAINDEEATLPDVETTVTIGG